MKEAMKTIDGGLGQALSTQTLPVSGAGGRVGHRASCSKILLSVGLFLVSPLLSGPLLSLCLHLHSLSPGDTNHSCDYEHV